MLQLLKLEVPRGVLASIVIRTQVWAVKWPSVGLPRWYKFYSIALVRANPSPAIFSHEIILTNHIAKLKSEYCRILREVP